MGGIAMSLSERWEEEVNLKVYPLGADYRDRYLKLLKRIEQAANEVCSNTEGKEFRTHPTQDNLDYLLGYIDWLEDNQC
jgi:hypothetical protein